jgi:ADP-ribose pyrophosphatase YjhB (NUDIX family)
MNTPTDSVRIVLFNKEDPARFLVLVETDDPTNQKLPGGKFDTVDETPDAAAQRELQEELGLDAQAVGLAQAAQLVNDDGVSARYIYGGMVDPSAVRPSHEIAEINWYTQEDLPEGKNRSHMISAVAAVRSETK